MDATIVLDGAAKWYGDRVALAGVSCSVGPGVTGLLGHNGAGKTTALKLIAGLASPSRGTVRVLGVDPKSDESVFARIGLAPDGDALWGFLTARAFVRLGAVLGRLPDPDAATMRALTSVDLADVAGRRVGGFSKGMTQRVKLAHALVHDPEVLLLDEPLNGLDPRQRLAMMDLLRRFGDEGRTVLVSSHILAEVERVAPRILVFVDGKLVAEGDTGDIREMIEERPRRVRVRSSDPARLAGLLVTTGAVRGLEIDGDGLAELEATDIETMSRELPAIARDAGIRLTEVAPVGDDLESVYEYLIERARGGVR